jgi:hypothetical protein
MGVSDEEEQRAPSVSQVVSVGRRSVGAHPPFSGSLGLGGGMVGAHPTHLPMADKPHP